MYDIPIVNLGMYGTDIGVRLTLYGCRPIVVGFKCAEAASFPVYLHLGWMNGILIRHGPQAERPKKSRDEILTAAARHELDRSDPLFEVVSNYESFQTMREHMRQYCAGLKPEHIDIERWMCALSVWLMLHRLTGMERPGEIDAGRANRMRAQTLQSLQDHGRAYFSIACSHNRAYVETVGEEFIDLTEVTDAASRAETPFMVGRPHRRAPKITQRH